MNDNKKDPLDNLFIDNHEPNRELIAEAIVQYVDLYGDTGEVLPKKTWDSLNLQNKILVFLLAKKALYLKDYISTEHVSPKDIESETGLKGNSIRPTLAKLLDERLVRKIEHEEGVKYFIPNYSINRIHSALVNG